MLTRARLEHLVKSVERSRSILLSFQADRLGVECRDERALVTMAQNAPTRSRPQPRIALIASSYNYIRDGVALTLNRLVGYLEKRGVEVLVFAPVGEKPAFDHQGTLVPVPSIALPTRAEYRLALGISRQAMRRLREFKPDLIHVALAPDILGYRALRAAAELQVPIVASYHTRYETYLKHYWYAAGLTDLLRWYLRYAYGSCREVYVPSQSTIDALLGDGFRNNFKLWPRGVDCGQFAPEKKSGSWREKYNIGEEELVVLFVSRLVREKQLDTLVATLKTVELSGVTFRSVIVGDGPERAALERRLPRAVFTGFLEGERLSQAYASADIFVFPSETETFGNVTLEAMASGLPCVCADATGSRSLVSHGKTGYLVDPARGAPDFARRIVDLAISPDLRRVMGAAARERALRFSWDEAMSRLYGYYTALLEGASE